MHVHLVHRIEHRGTVAMLSLVGLSLTFSTPIITVLSTTRKNGTERWMPELFAVVVSTDAMMAD